MSIEAGQTLSHYRLIEKIGEGGMGVVWRAADTALGRGVAIKIVSEAFANDTEHMARFEREAKLLGSLNHPNIATIFGLHHAETPTASVPFIAMEFVPGRDLAQRLKRGPMPLEAGLNLVRQIASALEAAHERGVIHRDLKPANVMLTEDGTVKVLDFGLAKSIGDAVKEDADADSPTVTSESTRNGVVLGTTAYMSPEQARGGTVDKRTDIWALGCILFELLTGARAYRGESATDVVAEVLKGEPAWDLLPDDTPAEVSQLIRRCLVKSPRDRLHDAADARLMIEDALARRAPPGAAHSTSDASPSARLRSRLGLLLSAVIPALALAVGILTGRLLDSSTDRAAGSFTIELPDGLTLPLDQTVPLALSPDGTQAVFVGVDGSNRRLYRRRFDSFDVAPIPGTEGSLGPVFSPDGRWIAFVDVAAGRIKKIDQAGGAAVSLGPATDDVKGLHWGSPDRLVLTLTHLAGVSVLNPETGEVVVSTQPDHESMEKTHRYPHLLPDGSAVLFMRGTADLDRYDEAEIELLDLATGTRRRLIEDGASPTYVPTGHVLFARDGALLAAPFSPRTAELTGPIARVLDGVTTSNSSGTAYYTISRAGHLAYLPGGLETFDHELVFVDRNGKVTASGLRKAEYRQVAVSPSGRKLAIEINAANDKIWIHDLDRGASTKLTAPWDQENPVWALDDRTVAYRTFAGERADGAVDGFRRAADGSGRPELMIENGSPLSWARGGQRLAFERDGDVWILDPEQGPEPIPFLTARFAEHDASFTRDGRWLAYVSDEAERDEVYVVPYPEKNKRWQLSADGGRSPRWSFDNRQLYYLHEQTMMVVDVEASPQFSAGPPRPLFETDARYDYLPTFDLFPDGRFVMIRAEKERRSSFRVVLNWVDRLDDRE